MNSQKSKVSAVLTGIIIGLAISGIAGAEQKTPMSFPSLKEYRIERNISSDAKGCISCHAAQSPGLVADWAKSRHAHANITCLDCHKAGPADKDVSKAHRAYSGTGISAIVSPKDCSRCHPSEAAEYSRSKHANTLEIIWKKIGRAHV